MKQDQSAIIPTIRYKDAKKAIEWLCKAFGFKKHLVVPGTGETIAHAQLTMGHAMIMLGSESENEYGKLLRTPKDLNGLNTQAPYMIIQNIDDHYKRAIREGAEIVIDIKNEDFGGRGYTCKDLEGHIWNFGSYNPWAS